MFQLRHLQEPAGARRPLPLRQRDDLLRTGPARRRPGGAAGRQHHGRSEGQSKSSWRPEQVTCYQAADVFLLMLKTFSQKLNFVFDLKH